MQISSAKDLKVYQKSYALAMDVFELSKNFPMDERFALTSQIRRSSRSVCLNLREAWAKRRYKAHFISKLTDCDGENSENRFISGLRQGLPVHNQRTTQTTEGAMRGDRKDARKHDQGSSSFLISDL